MSETRKLAEQLIELPSVTPDDGGCQSLLAKRLSQAGFSIDYLNFEDVSNLWAVIGDSGPLFTFVGHTDVVPPGPIESWDSAPFTPTVRDKFLFGRGAADMKSSLAAMVTAIERFLANNTLNFKLAYLVTSDEEGPAINGIKRVIETFDSSNTKIDYCLVGEPSSSESLGDTIKIGRRGSLNGKLKLLGVKGHVAYPHLAKNPIHIAAPMLSELVSETWDRGNEHFPPTSFQISNVHAGVGVSNVIPAGIEIDFNFRYSTETDDALIKERVVNILNKHTPDYELEWSLSGKPFLTQASDFIEIISDSVQNVVGKKPLLSTAGGTSDGRFIAPTGAQVVELGPSNKTIHKVNECVQIDDIEQLSTIYEKILIAINQK
ncbi:MAG: succinyl-diaminopimelate desuccinylase [Pseudohongiellaceae bacterium]